MKKYLLILVIAAVGCKKSNNTSPGVLITSWVFNSSPGVNTTSYFQYDSNNRLNNIVLGGRNIPISYNAQGLITSSGATGANQNYLQLTYDGNGNLTGGTDKVYDPSGQLQTSYNLTFMLTNGQVSQMNVYNLLSSTPTTVSFSYNNTYDSNGNLTKRIELNGSGAVEETDTYTYGTNHSPQINNHRRYNVSPLLNLFLNDDDDFYNTNERLSMARVITFGTPPAIQTTNFVFGYTSYNQQYPIMLYVGPGGNFTYSYSGL